MGKYLLCIIAGYLLGSLSPSAFLGKRRQTDLRKTGTKNLGASNVMLHFGKWMGAAVMALDIAKAVLAGLLAKWLLPESPTAVLAAGFSAVVGHVFPFYLAFRGGKGLATFGGMILVYDPVMFLVLLLLSGSAMLIINYSVAMPLTAGFLFPLLVGLKTKSLSVFLLAAAASGLIIVKHWSNIARAKNGEEKKVRDYLKA